MKKNYNYSHKYIINHHKPSYTMPFSGLCFTNIASSPERSHLADPELGVYGGFEPPNGRRGAPDVWWRLVVLSHETRDSKTWDFTKKYGDFTKNMRISQKTWDLDGFRLEECGSDLIWLDFFCHEMWGFNSCSLWGPWHQGLQCHQTDVIAAWSA